MNDNRTKELARIRQARFRKKRKLQKLSKEHSRLLGETLRKIDLGAPAVSRKELLSESGQKARERQQHDRPKKWAKDHGIELQKVANVYEATYALFFNPKKQIHELVGWSKTAYGKLVAEGEAATVKYAEIIANKTIVPREFRRFETYFSEAKKIVDPNEKDPLLRFTSSHYESDLGFYLTIGACYHLTLEKIKKKNHKSHSAIQYLDIILESGGNPVLTPSEYAQQLRAVCQRLKTRATWSHHKMVKTGIAYLELLLAKAREFFSGMSQNPLGFFKAEDIAPVFNSAKKNTTGLREGTKSRTPIPLDLITLLFSWLARHNRPLLNFLAMLLATGGRTEEMDRYEPKDWTETGLVKSTNPITKTKHNESANKKMRRMPFARAMYLSRLLATEPRVKHVVASRGLIKHLRQKPRTAAPPAVFSDEILNHNYVKDGLLQLYAARATNATNQLYVYSQKDSLIDDDFPKNSYARSVSEIILMTGHTNVDTLTSHYIQFSTNMAEGKHPHDHYHMPLGRYTLSDEFGVDYDMSDYNNVWELFLLRAYLRAIRAVDEEKFKEIKARLIKFHIDDTNRKSLLKNKGNNRIQRD